MRTIIDADIVIKQLTKSLAGLIKIVKNPAGFIEYWYLETTESVWVKMGFTLKNPTDGFEFDYEFLSGAGAEGYLTIYFDGDVAGHIDERYKEIGAIRSPRFALGRVEPGTHTLAFRIDPYTETASSVKIMDLKFYYQYSDIVNTINSIDLQYQGSAVTALTDAGKLNRAEPLSTNQEAAP